MHVLVTGHRGYIGSHLCNLLAAAGHEVTGVDICLFGECEWEAITPPTREWRMDFRGLREADLHNVDAVVHLAALSNDAMGQLDESLTLAVNLEGSVELARKARSAGVERFIFSGSCAVYGKGSDGQPLKEDAVLDPLTAYAQSKVEAERAISALADRHFHPVTLRNATAFGHSPAFRVDLVANDLLAAALVYGEIRIHSDGKPWRPLVHCRDIARACAACLDIPATAISGTAVNVGSNAENHQVSSIAEHVGRVVPEARTVYTGLSGPDPRDYRVSFDRMQTLFPESTIATSLAGGLCELAAAYRKHRLSAADLEGHRFHRLRTLIRENRLSWL